MGEVFNSKIFVGHVLTTRIKNTRIRLTRLTLLQIFQSWDFLPYYLGSLGFFLDWAILASPWAGYSRLQLGLNALGFSSGRVFLASPQVGCSRLLLRLGALGFSFTQMGGVPARRSDAKVRNGFMFFRQKSLFLTSYVDLLFI